MILRQTPTVRDTSCPGVPERPALRQRKDYVPLEPRDEFIVPLLRAEIGECMQRFATPARGGRKALDVGCGGQPFRAALERIGYSYCGVDVSALEDGTDVICAIDKPLPDELRNRGPFDFVLCTEVLEHVADWAAAFANFEALLASGGRVLITAPQFFHLHEEPYDFWRPTPYAIDYYARRNGLKVLEQRRAGDAWDILGVLLPNCRFVPRSRRLADRAAAKALRAGARLVFRALLRRKVQRRVRADGPLYLSNIAVLEKNAQ